MQRMSQWGAVICLILLIILSLLWEVWLAPLRPEGSWLALKALIAVIPLRGLLHGKRYTFQWSSMFILLYFLEGCMRLWADPMPIKVYALIEIVLSSLFFVACLLYTKCTRVARS